MEIYLKKKSSPEDIFLLLFLEREEWVGKRERERERKREREISM